jgi:hypothetical protein
MLHSVHILKNPSYKFSVKWFVRFKRGGKRKKKSRKNLYEVKIAFSTPWIQLTNLSFYLLDFDFNPLFLFFLFVYIYYFCVSLSFWISQSLSHTFFFIWLSVFLLLFYFLPRCHGVTRTTRIFSFPLGEFSDASPCLINACTSQWTLLYYVSVCLLKSTIEP